MGVAGLGRAIAGAALFLLVLGLLVQRQNRLRAEVLRQQLLLAQSGLAAHAQAQVGPGAQLQATIQHLPKQPTEQGPRNTGQQQPGQRPEQR